MRKPVSRAASRGLQIKSFPAPTSGLIKNQSSAIASGTLPNGQKVLGAWLMVNWFPTDTGVRMRGGSKRHATVGGTPKSFLSYANGNARKIFAATSAAIYDVTTPVSPNTSPVADVSGLSGGDWISVQFATAGGVFLRAVNGTDTPLVYDGTAWGTNPAITGVTPSTLSFVWAYKNRLFFIQKDSLDLWYLPVDSIGGAAVKFPLAGVFTRGGSLVFGETLSSDSGSGLDDRLVVFTSEGEMAIYEGDDPSSASNFSLAGVYRIGRPLGKRAFMKAGGDVVIATDIGFISAMSAVQNDYAALAPNAVSQPIETLWADYVAERFGEWQVTSWPTKQMALIALPQNAGDDPDILAVNVRTGAWTIYQGWPVLCAGQLGERLFFGRPDARIMEAEVTGADDGLPYTASVIGLFDDLKSPSERKIARLARAVTIGAKKPRGALRVNADFDSALPTPPDAPPDSGGAFWGSGIWGLSVWGARKPQIVAQDWESVSSTGFALAPVFSVTSGSLLPPDIELVRFDMSFEKGGIIT